MRSTVRTLLRLAAPLGLLLALALQAAGPAPLARAAAFTQGSVVVYRVGDGSGTLVSSGNPVFLDEFAPTGGDPIQSIAMPTAASEANLAVFAGTLPSEGLITRSADTRRLIVTGYSLTDLGLPATTTVPRVIAQVQGDGTIVSSTAPSDFASGGVPTSAASQDGLNFWATGGVGGIRYVPANATSSTQVVASPGSLLQVAIFDGQLYATTAAGSSVRLGAVGTGLPSAEGQTLTALPGLPTSGVPYGFFFADLSSSVAGLDTLYVAFDNAGLVKYALIGGVWTARGTVGADADNYRGLTGTVDGATVTLYATRDARELVRLTDGSGYNGAFAGAPALLATAPANTAFRGVALAPRAGLLAPDLTVSVTGPESAEVGTAFTYTLRVRNEGAVTAGGVGVRFTLPAGVAFIDAEGAGFAASQSGGVVSFTGGSLGVGGQASLLVSVSAAAVGPVTLPAGAAVADPDDPIPDEIDENNNSSTQTVVTRIVPEGGPSDDTTPPSTALTGQPADPTTATAATFSFTGQDETTPAEGLIFQCSLDGAPFGPCPSPQTYTGLAVGAHSFQVRAIDAAGNFDPSPASHSWAVWARLLAPLVTR